MTGKEIRAALLTDGTRFTVEDSYGQVHGYKIVRFSEDRRTPGDGISVRSEDGIKAANIERVTKAALSCYTFTLFGKKVVDRVTFDRITIIND